MKRPVGLLVGTSLLAAVAPVNVVPAAGAQEARAQEARAREAAADTLSLGRLHAAARGHDARAEQAVLNESSLELRLRNLSSEWLPRLRVRGEARYQSDVPRIEPSSPGDGGVPGISFPVVPKERYEAVVGVEQMLYDGGAIPGRRDLEHARTAEAQAHLSSTLYELRRDVDAAYFAVLALDSRREETGLLIEDLEARLSQARSGVRAGVRLPGEAAEIEAALLRARQRLDELRGDRRAALTVLTNLTGLALADDIDLPLPDLASEVASTREEAERAKGGEGPSLRRHPAFAAFRGTAERLEREADLAGRERRPKVVAFGEAGYGRPGPNIFGDAFDTFWLGGVRAEWAPWRWGRIGREQELLELRREAVETEERAFAAALERAVADELADLDRLRAALDTDERILDLRERVERQEKRRFVEGVITAADYVDARTDLLEASVALRLHRIELAEAQARYLATLGVPIP